MSVTYGKDRAHNESQHLLDEAELNIGSSQVSEVSVSRPFNALTIAPGKEIRLLDLKTASEKGRTISVVMAQTIQETEDNPIANTSGPITGIVEFTTGASGLIRVEFDIPAVSRLPCVAGIVTSNPILGAETSYPPQFISPAVSGVALCVPASSVRVYARNDNNMPQVWDPRVIIGSSGPLDIDPTINAGVFYGEVFGANKHLKKSIYIAEAGDIASAIPSGGLVRIGIPPFAKSMRFPRFPLNSTSLDVTFDTYFGVDLGPYAIAAGSDGPIEVPPGAYRMVITVSSVIAVNDLVAIFDLAI